MKIGNNIHTTSNKKAYRKPVLEVVEMDREMKLIMMSPLPDHGGDGPVLPSSQGTTQPNYENYTYPKQDNPFGGGTVDFQR